MKTCCHLGVTNISEDLCCWWQRVGDHVACCLDHPVSQHPLHERLDTILASSSDQHWSMSIGNHSILKSKRDGLWWPHTWTVVTQSCSCSGGFVEGAAPAIPWSSSVLGAFVPLLVPAVKHAHYEVSPWNLDEDATGIARRYLHGAICTLLCFQNWFAWKAEMRGRWLLLGTADLYLLYMCALVIPTRNRLTDDALTAWVGNSNWIPWKVYLWHSLILSYPMKSYLHASGCRLTSNSWRSCICFCGCPPSSHRRKTEGVGRLGNDPEIKFQSAKAGNWEQQ